MTKELEEKAFTFSKDVRSFCRKIKWDIINIEDIRQLTKASGLMAAAFISAREKISETDTRMRLRLAKKDAKVVSYWLRLLYNENPDLEKERLRLIYEAEKLQKIFAESLVFK